MFFPSFFGKADKLHPGTERMLFDNEACSKVTDPGDPTGRRLQPPQVGKAYSSCRRQCPKCQGVPT